MQGENIMLTPDNFPVPKTGFKEIRANLIGNKGVIYQDQWVQVQYDSKFNLNRDDPECGDFKIIMQFTSNSGPITIRRANVLSSEGCNLKLHPIKMVNDHPQLFIDGTCIGVVNKLPLLQIKFNQDAQERLLEFSLPIFVHKFFVPEQSDVNTFEQMYAAYNNKNEVFKLDEFIKNPSPGVPLTQVMQKIGGLMGQGIGMQALAYPNPQNCKKVVALARYCFKGKGSNNYFPIICEIEGYEEHYEQLRFSIRTFGSPFLAQALYQVVMLHLEM